MSRCYHFWLPILAAIIPACAILGQPGDFNGDGLVDCEDGRLVSEQAIAGSSDLIYDLDSNGVVNRNDAFEWLRIAGRQNVGAPYLLGDANLDGSVDTGDYGGVYNKNKFATETGPCHADVNVDGVVDVTDALIIKANFFFESSEELDIGRGASQIESDVVGLIYDPGTGELYLRSPETKTTTLVIEGPEIVERLSFTEIFADGIAWTLPIHFAGKQQWDGREILPDVVGMLGNHRLARYEAGLSESDFGVVEYGTIRFVQDLGGVLTTTVQVETVLPGDANLDGYVDVSDFNIWNANKFTSDGSWGEGDFNSDGMVDVSDFNIWNSNKFTSAGWGEPQSPLPVPEPSARLSALWIVLALGIVNRRT